MKKNDSESDLIVFLKTVLEFYGNTDNYYSDDIHNSLIKLDNGFQARNAISRFVDLQNQQTKMESDFETLINSEGLNENVSEMEMKEIINKLKQLK